MSGRVRTLLAVIALAAATSFAAPRAAAAVAPAAISHRIMFDNSKGETAGNADWIVGTAMPDPTAQNPNPTSER
jgi:hypothetical protein